MHQSHSARDFVLARRSISPMAVALSALVFAIGCDDNDALHFHGAAGSAGMDSAIAGHGGAGTAGTASSRAGSAGKGAVAGSGGSEEAAGNAGSGEAAGSSGSAGSAGSGEAAGSGGTSGGAGSGGTSGGAGSSGAAGSAGSGGGAGSGGIAGASGSGGVAGSAGSGAIAGAGGSGPTSNCATGGTLFVVGNYADTAGNQVLLRAAPKAATFALLPPGVANPTKPPQLFQVNRVCAPGGALIASDGSSNYRVDFIQSGSQLALCLSDGVPTLQGALLLPPADTAHAASTGCAGHAFTTYSAGAF